MSIRPGYFYFFNSEDDKVLVSIGDRFLNGYGTITILEEPNDAAYEMLKKRSNYNFSQNITTKQLVTRQDSKLSFSNLTDLILGEEKFNLQRNDKTLVEIYTYTDTTQQMIAFKNNVRIGDDNKGLISYNTYANENKPLSIYRANINNSFLKNCEVADKLTFSETTNITTTDITGFKLKNCTFQDCVNNNAFTQINKKTYSIDELRDTGVSVAINKMASIYLYNSLFSVSFIVFCSDSEDYEFDATCHTNKSISLGLIPIHYVAQTGQVKI